LGFYVTVFGPSGFVHVQVRPSFASSHVLAVTEPGYRCPVRSFSKGRLSPQRLPSVLVLIFVGHSTLVLYIIRIDGRAASKFREKNARHQMGL